MFRLQGATFKPNVLHSIFADMIVHAFVMTKLKFCYSVSCLKACSSPKTHNILHILTSKNNDPHIPYGGGLMHWLILLEHLIQMQAQTPVVTQGSDFLSATTFGDLDNKAFSHYNPSSASQLNAPLRSLPLLEGVV